VTNGLGLVLNGAISGGFNLTKTGMGTAHLGGSSANTYGGITYVNQGMLTLVKATGTAVPNDLVVGDGVNAATVRLDAQRPALLRVRRNRGNLQPVGPEPPQQHHRSLTLSNGTVATGSGTLMLNGPGQLDW